MNPPNDIGKRELPPGLRNRFTEFYVDELEDKDDLRAIVSAFLSSINGVPTNAIDAIVDFYLTARKKSAELTGTQNTTAS